MGCCFVGRDLSETLSWINLVGWNPLSRESCELIPSRGGVSTLTAVCGDYEWHVESCFLLRRKFTQFFMKAFFHPCLMVTSYQNHHMLKTNAIILYCSTSEEKNISNQYFLHDLSWLHGKARWLQGHQLMISIGASGSFPLPHMWAPWPSKLLIAWCLTVN